MNSENNTPENINTKRRGFTKLGVAAPVLMTLASQPVLGANCLSNAMSGNLSDPTRGSCDLGWSPGGWKTPGGAPDWGPTGFTYGEYSPTAKYTKKEGEPLVSCGLNKKNEPECWNGATLLSGTGAFGALFAPELKERSLSSLLREYTGNSSSPPMGHYISAFLNASYSSINYALTVHQVIGLIDGSIPVPPGFGGSLTSYLDSTWNGL